MAKQKTVYFAASVVMSLPSGWGSVLPVSSGILLQKRKLQKRKRRGEVFKDFCLSYEYIRGNSRE
jgi:hypothetical protein